MRPTRPLLLCLTALALTVATVRPAWADATLFVGSNLTPSNRPVLGASLGIGLLIVGFEFEYSSTSSDDSAAAPSLKTGMGNVLLQTPGAIYGFQPYVTGGLGLYHEELGTHGDTDVGLNLGGGVKIGLVGPIKLRVDFRTFRLGNGALYSPAHRVYAGLNVGF